VSDARLAPAVGRAVTWRGNAAAAECRRGARGDDGCAGAVRPGPQAGTFYYHRNHLNSSSVVTDKDGEPVTRMVYLPYGEISQANSTGQEAVTSKYTGQEFDQETGLYNYGARFYDPSVGRFMSADTIVPSLTDSQAFNRYSYARGNPIIYTDPTGHSFWSVLGSIFGTIFNAIGAALAMLGRALVWVVKLHVEAVKFVIKGHMFALQIARGMLIAAATNPLAALGMIMAVAAGPPGWVGLVAAVAAQGMAMAAGIRDPHTLAIIGVMAGAVAGGLAAALKGTMKYGAEEIAKAAGAPQWLVSAAALGMSLVNTRSRDPERDEVTFKMGGQAPGAPVDLCTNMSKEQQALASVAVGQLEVLNPVSVANSQEICGWILRSSDGTLTVSEPVLGGADSCPAQLMPGIVGSYHTHGSWNTSYVGFWGTDYNEIFSPSDLGLAKLTGPAFLATPLGSILMYDPKGGRHCYIRI